MIWIVLFFIAFLCTLCTDVTAGLRVYVCVQQDLLRSDSKAYDKFYEEFGIFLKEVSGVISCAFVYSQAITGHPYRRALQGRAGVTAACRVFAQRGWLDQVRDIMIREVGVVSSLFFDSVWGSLDTYVDRMRATQEEIFYLHDASRTMAESSPYFEAFRKKGIEVIFLYSMTDEVSGREYRHIFMKYFCELTSIRLKRLCFKTLRIFAASVSHRLRVHTLTCQRCRTIPTMWTRMRSATPTQRPVARAPMAH